MTNLHLDGNLLLKDIEETERLAHYLYNEVSKLKDGKALETMMVVNVIKARNAIKEAVNFFNHQG